MSEDTKTLIVVLLLIFAFPIGVILMWFWVKWPVWVKVLLTIPFVLLFFAIIGMVAGILLLASNPSGYHTNMQYNMNSNTMPQPQTNGNGY